VTDQVKPESSTDAALVSGSFTLDPNVGHDAGPANRRGIALALLSAVFAAHFLDRQILAILIPPIKSELGLSDTALGVLSGLAFTVLFSSVGLVIGRLADGTDRARIHCAMIPAS
jgi:MFS family permease